MCHIDIKYIFGKQKKCKGSVSIQKNNKYITNETCQKGTAQSILIQMKGRHTEKHDGASNSSKFNPVTSSCP